MSQFEHIAIIGTGLIGGSFALAVRAAGFDGRITGYDTRENLEIAINSAIIDGPEESFSQNKCCAADLIYLATPIKAILDFFTSHGHQLKVGALVTDSGSTKRVICEAAAALPAEVNFIGGHPMAGSQHHGIAAARADLFHNAVYLLVPRAHTPEQVVLQFELLVREIGARPRKISADWHDEAVAMVSHLPQLLSSALAAISADKNADKKELLSLAGAGFRDMSRLGESSWSVWRDICATNRDYLAVALSEIIELLTVMRDSLNSDTGDTLEKKQMQEVAECFSRARRIFDRQI